MAWRVVPTCRAASSLELGPAAKDQEASSAARSATDPAARARAQACWLFSGFPRQKSSKNAISRPAATDARLAASNMRDMALHPLKS